MIHTLYYLKNPAQGLECVWCTANIILFLSRRIFRTSHSGAL